MICMAKFVALLCYVWYIAGYERCCHWFRCECSQKWLTHQAHDDDEPKTSKKWMATNPNLEDSVFRKIF